jgi:hypothetical protein
MTGIPAEGLVSLRQTVVCGRQCGSSQSTADRIIRVKGIDAPGCTENNCIRYGENRSQKRSSFNNRHGGSTLGFLVQSLSARLVH